MQYKIKEKHIETIIVYGSCYGTAKIYAEAMAEQMLYEQVKKQPVEEQDADTRAMIETYRQKVSFVDLACLDNIVKKPEG